MKKIAALTPEQIAKFPEYVKKWTDIGLSTQPADRPRAKAAIEKMYQTAGKKAPQIVWCGSPLSQALTRAVIKDHSVGESVWDSVVKSVGDSVWASVWASVSASVRASVGESVRDNVWESVSASVQTSVGDSPWDSVYGAHDAHWLAFYKFFCDECGLSAETEKLGGLWELAQSAGWALPHENICWVSERHTTLKQTQAPDGTCQLHCEDGPAVAYPDGWKLWFIQGIAVTEQTVMQPETLTLAQIDSEANAEVRRIMIERFGFEKYLRACNAQLIDSCPNDHALKGLRTAKLWAAKDLVMLDVLNSTPEPDGTTKRYVIPVDGSRYDGEAGRTCMAATASTWRKRGDKTQLAFSRWQDYAPGFES